LRNGGQALDQLHQEVLIIQQGGFELLDCAAYTTTGRTWTTWTGRTTGAGRSTGITGRLHICGRTLRKSRVHFSLLIGRQG
jgi:hypothetical protein